MTGLRQPLRAFPLLVAAALLAMPGALEAHEVPHETNPHRGPVLTGGGTDTVARIISQKMGESWGQAMVIENRTGAGGTIGTALVAKATPDGHTLLVSSSAFAINAAMDRDLPYDPLKDFSGVTRIGYSKSMLVVTPTIGVRSLKDFIEYARARPGKIFFSSGGAGSSTHLNAERFRLAAGIKPVHVAFKGSADATLEVVAGRCHYVVTGLISTLSYIRDGKLVALAVITPERSSLLPDVPTMAETLPGYKRDGSHVMLAPAGTPRPVLERISSEVRRIFDLPDVKERLANFDYLLVPSTPAEMDKILRADIQTFAEVIAKAGLRPK